MNANDLRRLHTLLERACPEGIDPLLWRRCQEAVRAEPTPTARRDYPLSHLAADPFLRF